MANTVNFCPSCGTKLDPNAKFCKGCGLAIETSNGNQRQQEWAGKLVKCPSCGEDIPSFTVICPACGIELRGTRSSSAISMLAEKLENTTSEKQRIIIIKSFPIPNTREDIFEFMLLAASNFDSSYYATHLHEENISDAWLAKIEQCYSKAKLSFGTHPDFERIESIYLRIKADCADKERKIKYEEKARRDEQGRIETEKDFKKSKLRAVIVIFAVISALCVAVSFNDENILSGIIAILMFASFVTAFLMGSGVIKEKIRNMRLLPLILAFVLFIPYFSSYSSGTIDDSSTDDDFTEWNDILLNEYAPNPVMTSASVMINSREEFYIYDIKCSTSQYYDYIDSCKVFGYDYEIIDEDEHSFVAYSEGGYKIKVLYITDLSVELNAPMAMSSIEWPSSNIAKLIPQPKSLYGKIEWEHDYGFVIYIGNTTLAQYREYVSSVYDAGFNIDYNKGDTYFEAENADGYHVRIDYEGFNTVFIRIDEPDED